MIRSNSVLRTQRSSSKISFEATKKPFGLLVEGLQMNRERRSDKMPIELFLGSVGYGTSSFITFVKALAIGISIQVARKSFPSIGANCLGRHDQ